MRYIFCPNCGTKLTKILAGDDGPVPYCNLCQKRWFDTFSSCVIVLTYNEFDEIVLTRQNYLSKEFATITSGYITPGETAEESAIREVKEELGLDLETLEYGGTYWFEENDMLMHGFLGFTHKKDFVLSSEVDSAKWVPALDVSKFLYPDFPGNAAYGLYRKFLKKKGFEK